MPPLPNGSLAKDALLGNKGAPPTHRVVRKLSEIRKRNQTLELEGWQRRTVVRGAGSVGSQSRAGAGAFLLALGSEWESFPEGKG